MPQADTVARECVVKKDGCNLLNKCDECKVAIKKLIEADDMFAEYFAQIEYLKQSRCIQ